MTIETLISQRDALQALFDEQSKIKQEAENEQLRLQGQYKLLNQLIEQEQIKSEKAKKDKK